MTIIVTSYGAKGKSVYSLILYNYLQLSYVHHHNNNRGIGEGNGTPLQYSCLENPMDGGAWWATVHRVSKSRTQLRDFTFTFHFHALEKEMATHSSVLAWRISGTGEPGGLPSMGPHRVGHNWSNLAAAASTKELMLLNCGVGEDSWESLGLRGDPTRPS